jgi:hypothetical protein
MNGRVFRFCSRDKGYFGSIRYFGSCGSERLGQTIQVAKTPFYVDWEKVVENAVPFRPLCDKAAELSGVKVLLRLKSGWQNERPEGVHDCYHDQRNPPDAPIV